MAHAALGASMAAICRRQASEAVGVWRNAEGRVPSKVVPFIWHTPQELRERQRRFDSPTAEAIGHQGAVLMRTAPVAYASGSDWSAIAASKISACCDPLKRTLRRQFGGSMTHPTSAK